MLPESYEYSNLLRPQEAVPEIYADDESGEEYVKSAAVSSVSASAVSDEDGYQEADLVEEDDSVEETTETESTVETEEETSDDSSDDTATSDNKTKTTSTDSETEEVEGTTLKEFKKFFKQDDEYDELCASYGYENLFNIIDDNGDGVITDDEIVALGLDAEKISELTVDDIKNIAKLAGLPDIDEAEEEDSDEEDDDEFEISDELLAKLKEALGLTDSTDDTDDTTAAASTTGTSGTSGTGGTSSTGGSTSSSGGTTSSTTSAAETADEMSMEELLEQQEVKQAAVDDANAKVAEVQSGENAEVKAAIDDADEKQQIYEDALEADDEVSEELKQQQKDNQAAIEEQEKIVTDSETAIAEAEATIYDCDTQIGLLDNQISALNTSMSNLPEKTSDNEDDWADIDAMKQSIQSQIDDAEASKEEYEGQKSDAETAKSDAEDALDAAQKELDDNLYPERDDIEEQILNSCSDETKKALEDWQAARENIETVKAEQLSAAQAELETAQSELEEVIASIEELESMQIQLENRISSNGEDVVEFALALDGLSASEMKQLMQAAGCQFDSGAWCADFVAYVTSEVIGSDSEFLSTCSNTAYCPTIASWASSNGILSDYGDSSDVEPGDYIIYYNDSKGYYHIGIVTSVNDDGTVNTVEGNTSDDNGNYTSGVVNTKTNRTGYYVKIHELDS